MLKQVTYKFLLTCSGGAICVQIVLIHVSYVDSQRFKITELG